MANNSVSLHYFFLGSILLILICLMLALKAETFMNFLLKIKILKMFHYKYHKKNQNSLKILLCMENNDKNIYLTFKISIL